MKKRFLSTATTLVDPMDIVSQLLEATAASASPSVPHEIVLDPPVGARVERMTVAGAYRSPVPILWDAATRTAYPIRSVG